MRVRVHERGWAGERGRDSRARGGGKEDRSEDAAVTRGAPYTLQKERARRPGAPLL